MAAVVLIIFVRWGSPPPRPEQGVVGRSLRLENFRAVVGTDVFRSELYDDSGAFSSYGRTRNILFIEPTGAGRWLLPDDDHVVHEYPVREGKATLRDDDGSTIAGVALAIPINADPKVGVLLLFDPTGARVQELAQSVREVHGVDLTPEHTIAVLYERSGEYVLGHYEAGTFKKLREAIVSVPPLK